MRKKERALVQDSISRFLIFTIISFPSINASSLNFSGSSITSFISDGFSFSFSGLLLNLKFEISILLKILLIIIPLLLSRVVYFSRNRRCNFGVNCSNIFPVETGLPSSFGQRLHFQRPHKLPHGHSRIKAIRASSSPLIKILLKVWMQI